MEKEEYLRLLREFREGDMSLVRRVMDEALRRGDYALAQEALDTMRNGYGEVHRMETQFIEGGKIRSHLRGPKGAIQFMIMYVPTGHSDAPGLLEFSMMGADIGYHSYVPLYEGQQCDGPCPVLDGADCYYEGSGARAAPILRRIFEGGEQTLREVLEEEYQRCFGPL